MDCGSAPATELVRGRRLVCHNNLIGDAKAYGAIYVNEDVVVDGDLITGRSGGHAHLFAKKSLKPFLLTRTDMETTFFHLALTVKNLAKFESFYSRHFGFKRARVRSVWAMMRNSFF
jgi:hypothetical protein